MRKDAMRRSGSAFGAKQGDVEDPGVTGTSYPKKMAAAGSSWSKKCKMVCAALGLMTLIHVTRAPSFWFGIFQKMEVFGSVSRFFNHGLYQYLDTLDKDGEVTCMNYGFKDLSNTAEFNLNNIKLDPKDEPERYCMQMYHKVATPQGMDLTGLNVLEVGSGRGGGAAYIKRYLNPKTMTGLDYSSKGVAFCQKKHAQGVEGLQYVQGDAGHLPFDDESFDVVINVESSHCYDNFPKFLSEVYRVLKPGGKFSWVDLRRTEELAQVNRDFRNTKFQQLGEEDVTAGVVAAMTTSGERNKELIDRAVPRFARSVFYSFAGVEGTSLHNDLSNRAMVYKHKVLLKKEL